MENFTVPFELDTNQCLDCLTKSDTEAAAEWLGRRIDGRLFEELIQKKYNPDDYFVFFDKPATIEQLQECKAQSKISIIVLNSNDTTIDNVCKYAESIPEDLRTWVGVYWDMSIEFVKELFKNPDMRDANVNDFLLLEKIYGICEKSS